MSVCHSVVVNFLISAFFFIFQNTKYKPANSAEIPNPVNTKKKKSIYSLAFVHYDGTLNLCIDCVTYATETTQQLFAVLAFISISLVPH